MTEPQTTVLIVEDDQAVREVLRLRLASWGYAVEAAADAAEAQEKAESCEPQAVVADVVLPDVSGLELLKALQQGDVHRPVILVTSHATVDLAVEAMKEGARDFLTKPLQYDQLRASLEAALSERRARLESRRLTSTLAGEEARLEGLVGASDSMRRVYASIREAGPTDAAVLVSGESGTGKELVARAIHALSARSGAPFIALNAAAIPKDLMESEIFGHEKGAFTGASGARHGCFEQADGGTLFFDEIAEMPLALQPKLLRVLEDGRVRRLGGSREIRTDVRIVAATNSDPRQAMEEGRLREDLYYRLSVFAITLPPLRERREDVPLLVQHFCGQFSAKHEVEIEGVRAEAQELLEAYDWPGNVRELRNVVERAVVLATSGWIQPSHLPPHLQRAERPSAREFRFPPGMTMADAEKALILQTLRETGNNKAEAARRLGIATRTIYNKLKSYEEP